MSDRPDPAVFVAALRKSGLLAADRLRELAAHADLPDRLVDTGELTQFQADKLRHGQWQGLRLGPYRVLSPLGRGGMGVVYLARESAAAGMARPLLAVKILPPIKATREPRTRARFLREMDLGRAVPPHPRIARVFDTGEVSGVLYIAMEYVPGRNIKAMVQADGPMRSGDAARVFAQACDGLAAAHAAGLIHRDLKPANVVIRPDGDAKLLDFGLAIRVGEQPDPTDPGLIGGPGYTLGTLDYIAPEQTEDATAITPAADLYALGCSLYFALTGSPPFPGGSVHQKLAWHRTEEPPPLRSVRPDVPEALAAAVDRLMDKNPAARYETAMDAADALWRTAADPVPASPVVFDLPDEEGASSAVVEDEELWEADVIEGPRSSEVLPEEDERPAWADVPVWGWAAVTAGVLLVSMAAGFLTRLARG